MSKDLTPKGINATVRGPLAAGTISTTPLTQRVDIKKIMTAKLADRIADGAD